MKIQLPAKTAAPTPENVAALDDGLASVIAGHAQATSPWTFYEVLDEYLGPWGMAGYPIAYGKFYCVAFTSNQKIANDATARQWVWKTTIALQQALKDFVVGRFKAGTLAGLTEAELRAAAFDSHPLAYTKSGLTVVVMAAPELLPIIVLIPRAEFVSSNAPATWKQLAVTSRTALPEAIGIGLATLAGPAHNGMFRLAAQRDLQETREELALIRELAELKTRVESGALDNVEALNRITRELNVRQFPNQQAARFAAEIIRAAAARKRYIARTYRDLVRQRPDIKPSLDRLQPGWEGY